MGKATHSDVLDGALDIIRNNCTRVTLCSAQPTTYAEANATYMLASVTVSSSDFTKANGDTSGRKLTFGGKTGVSVTTGGNATHLAYLDVTNSKLLDVHTTPTTAVAGAGTVDIGSCKNEIAAPS